MQVAPCSKIYWKILNLTIFNMGNLWIDAWINFILVLNFVTLMILHQLMWMLCTPYYATCHLYKV